MFRLPAPAASTSPILISYDEAPPSFCGAFPKSTVDINFESLVEVDTISKVYLAPCIELSPFKKDFGILGCALPTNALVLQYFFFDLHHLLCSFHAPIAIAKCRLLYIFHSPF